ncbi:hypothetical protein ACFLQL_03710 [Verrucomicrobiota bacterium]
MKHKEILNVIRKAYKTKFLPEDPITKFIIDELNDIYRPEEKAEFKCLDELIEALCDATDQLNVVIRALDGYFCKEIKKQHKKIKDKNGTKKRPKN